VALFHLAVLFQVFWNPPFPVPLRATLPLRRDFSFPRSQDLVPLDATRHSGRFLGPSAVCSCPHFPLAFVPLASG